MKKILLFLLFGLILVAGCKSSGNPSKECSVDSDCVPASCCHADACVAVGNAPDCSGIYCSQECKENTLDCGQAKCVCDAGKCSVGWKNQQ